MIFNSALNATRDVFDNPIHYTTHNSYKCYNKVENYFD